VLLVLFSQALLLLLMLLELLLLELGQIVSHLCQAHSVMCAERDLLDAGVRLDSLACWHTYNLVVGAVGTPELARQVLRARLVVQAIVDRAGTVLRVWIALAVFFRVVVAVEHH
jgi:hypothetical protein